MNLPTISSYGNYPNSNSGAHCLCFSHNGVVFYFSYQTLVAFYHSKCGLVCSENVWSRTTGKHLNKIQSDKKNRVKHELFEQIYDTIFNTPEQKPEEKHE